MKFYTEIGLKMECLQNKSILISLYDKHIFIFARIENHKNGNYKL